MTYLGLGILDPEEGVHDLAGVELLCELLYALLALAQQAEGIGVALVAEESPVNRGLLVSHQPPGILYVRIIQIQYKEIKISVLLIRIRKFPIQSNLSDPNTN